MSSDHTMMTVMAVSLALMAIAFVAIAVVAIRAMTRLEKVADELKAVGEGVRGSFVQVDGVVQQFRDDIVPHVRRVAAQFEKVGDRTAHLSSAVLDEVETPARTAVALVTGVRTGTNALLSAIARRTRGSHNGG